MARQREPLPRLNITPSLNAQQPIGGMFSPALPTALQQSFHPPFTPLPNAMQTPMQPYFPPQPPHAPNRPTHHQGQASIAQLAAAGILPPSGFPMTPIGGHFSRPSLMLGPGQLQPFPHRNRRQPSIGGPPKAVLGGPARKLSPVPPGISVSPVPPAKTKKVAVNLPKETIPGEGDEPPTRPSWARTPLQLQSDDHEQNIGPIDLHTRETYPPDGWTHMMPEVVDVFLPGKGAWDQMRQQVMEEKLEKLGVERGSGSNVPHIYAPHARAASVSSPADPTILLYKLNQLQRSREGSALNSLSASPQPPFGLSPSPHRSTPGFVPPRHGYTMSLAQPPSYLVSPYEETASTNPFGHDAILGDDQPQPNSPFLLEKAPSIQIVTSLNSSAVPPPISAVQPPDSRPDFNRGFGLDITEEEEEEEEDYQDNNRDGSETDATQDMDLDEDGDRTHRSYSHKTSPFASRHHSRHTSKISAHLSLGSFGASDLAPEMLQDSLDNVEEAKNATGRAAMDDVDEVGEWTGTDTDDDGQSIGEWSNPSDEERARRERVERRLRRRAEKLNLDKPRRIPNFPRPPGGAAILPSLRSEEDIISNPSEENLVLTHHQGQYLRVDPDYFSPDGLSQVLSHSRAASAEYSVHDPAQAHSRTPSDEFVYPDRRHQPQPSFGKRDLNPFAAPFVFGAPLASSSPAPAVTPPLPSISISTHSRLSSVGGKTLNVAAPEFKPSGFTFRPPPGVPQMPVPPPEVPKPLSPPAIKDERSPSFVLQGREKRQRRGSTASMEEGDSMVSFKFPRDVDSPRGIRRSTSYSGSHHLDPSAEPFTFAGFSAVAQPPAVPREPEAPGQRTPTPEEVTLQDDSTAKGDNVEATAEEYNIPSSSKKRAPIPMDFKQPVSNNTVPAGLFKALANGDDRTRRTVRSRLSSREIYDHLRRPSMDDNDVPQISRKRSQRHMTMGSTEKAGSISDDDVFGASRHTRRRSSLPDNLRDELDSISHESIPPMDLTSRMELHRVEHVVGELLDAKFTELRRELAQDSSKSGQALNPSTEAQIADVISLFRTQLQESATRSLEDSQMDARGEMDFQLIRDVVQEGQKELLGLVRRELRGVVAAGSSDGENLHTQGVVDLVDAIGNKIIGAVRETISDLSARQEAISHAAPARERDAIVDKLITVLTPTLASIRSEPLDYDFLTSQLTQAVKPHISQLIDLASDKRETASLIVESLLPLLPSMQTPTVDTDAITLQLITEVRRAIAPIDAFEIREQVADLVVERLDSRLAVRDKAFNVEVIATKFNESVSQLLEPSQGVSGKLESLAEGQNSLKAQQEEYGAVTKRLTEVIQGLPATFEGSLESIAAAQKDVIVKLEDFGAPRESNQDILDLKTSVERLEEGHRTIAAHNSDTLALYKGALGKVEALPEVVKAAIAAVQNDLIDRINSRDSMNRELEELRKANTEMQVQLAKARGSHGQVRVEKDLLAEKLVDIEAEREHLRARVNELETASATGASEKATLEERNTELEEALSKALSRLQAADVTSQANTGRIAELETVNLELMNSKGSLESKINSLEMHVQLVNKDKETTVHALEALQQQHKELQSQQQHWETLRQTSERIEHLATLIGQADNEELHELRHHREQSLVLEADYNNLQKRFKDLENKVLGSEKLAATARQNLTQAQQRASDWERRTKEAEGQLEAVRTELDHAEQMRSQLDADYALVKLQLEEHESEGRAAKDREAKTRETITALENKVRNLQTELEKTRTIPEQAAPYRSLANGYSHPPPRPDSRASTVYGDRSATPTRRMSSYTSSPSIRSDTPPQASVWDSMHAPGRGTPARFTPTNIQAPTGRYPSSLVQGTPKSTRRSVYRPVAPSPTPSVVSNAPTLRDDGWYE